MECCENFRYLLRNYKLPTSLIKLLLIGLNFLAFAVGITLLAASLWVRSDSALWVYASNLDNIHRFYLASYFGMAVGSLSFIVSIVSCFGAFLDSRLLLLTSVLITLVLLTGESILVFNALRPPLGDSLQAQLAYDIHQHIIQIEYSANSRNFIDLMQLKLQCCAAYSFLDYKTLNMNVPQSCSNDLTNNINYRSCGEILRRYLEIRAALMSGLALILLTSHSFSALISLLYYKFKRSIKENI